MKNYTKVTNMETPMMKRELWQKLDDRQAETVSGGTGDSICATCKFVSPVLWIQHMEYSPDGRSRSTEPKLSS